MTQREHRQLMMLGGLVVLAVGLLNVYVALLIFRLVALLVGHTLSGCGS